MAGTPQASFLANLYLKDLDRYFYDNRIPYARYSDDIILFARSEEEVRSLASFVKDYLAELGLSVNPDKECFSSPGEGWTFLGFTYCRGVVDIAPASVAKIKAKMHRKSRSLTRWYQRNGKDSRSAARAFIRIFNRKLFEGGEETDLTWSRWYFPVINTTGSLTEIDRYAQDCVRFIVSGKRTKGRFAVTYEDICELGLRNLVHEYYRCAPDASS